MRRAFVAFVRATSLDDLRVYQNAKAAEAALAPMLERRGFLNQAKLRGQIYEVARGACNEIIAHLSSAAARKCITSAENDALSARYTIIGKQLTRWIQHLNREDRKQRG